MDEFRAKLEKQRCAMKDMKLLIWLTQLGLSVASQP